MSHPSVTTLKKIPLDTIKFNARGRAWFRKGMDVFEDRIREHYGELPLPQAAIQDDLTLCLFWETDDKPIVIRFDDESWDNATDPFVDDRSELN